MTETRNHYPETASLATLYHSTVNGLPWRLFAGRIVREAFGYCHKLPVTRGWRSTLLTTDSGHKFMLYLRPSQPSWVLGGKRRVFVNCPRCKDLVAFGVIYNHKCK